MLDELLTVAEVAQILRVKACSIHRYVRLGRIEAVHVGSLRRIRRSTLETLIGKKSEVPA